MKLKEILSRIAVATLLAASGCVSSQYRLASEPTAPVSINVAKAQPPVEALVHSVIIQRGPGSWKRDAFWDEYVLSIANRGDTPLTLQSARVIDFQGVPAMPGDDPWAVEQASRQWLKAADASGIGRGVAIGTVSVASAYAVMAKTIALASAEVSGATVTAGLTLWALPLTAPVYVMTGTAVDLHRKDKIEREFARRHLVFPVTIAPGQVAQGSLFVRIAPQPKWLELRCNADGRLHVVTLELNPALAGLHLKPDSQPKPAPPPAAHSRS